MRLNRRPRGGPFGVLGVEDALVLAAVVALPWVWGGVALDTYRIAAAVIAVAAGWALARHGAAGLGLDRRALWLLPAILLGTWAFVQVVPLPRAWVAVLSPRAAALQADAFGPEGLDSVQWLRHIEEGARARVPEAAGAKANSAGAFALGTDAPSPPRRFTLSLLPSVTLERAYWYSALLLAFLLVHRRTADPDRATAYRAVLFVSFGVLALVSMANRLTAPTRLLWLRDVSGYEHPFGPFVNPSHFAAVMELASPWLLGYGLASTARAGAPDRRRTSRNLALLGAGVCAGAALLAASKMAAMTIGIAFAVLIGVAAATRRGRERNALLASAAAAALLLGGIALYGPLRGRIADFASTHTGGLSQNLRGMAWTSGLRLARDHAWTGSGFGALGEVLPAYLPRGESGAWNKLHNDYLELYIGGGAVAAVLFAWLAATYVSRCWRVFRSAAGSGRLLPTLGLVLGLVAIAAHEYVDFSLQIPAVALLFVTMAAIGVSPLVRPSEEA